MPYQESFLELVKKRGHLETQSFAYDYYPAEEGFPAYIERSDLRSLVPNYRMVWIDKIGG